MYFPFDSDIHTEPVRATQLKLIPSSKLSIPMYSLILSSTLAGWATVNDSSLDKSFAIKETDGAIL